MFVWRGTLIGIVMLAIITPTMATDLYSGLALYYSFDDIQGNILKDNSGNGQDGTIFGNPATVGGISGTALYFDGVDDRIKIPHTAIDNKTEITVVFWIRTNDEVFGLISGANAKNDNEYWIFVGGSIYGKTNPKWSGKIRIRYYGNDVCSLSDPINDGKWKMVAVVTTFKKTLIYI